jgi:hypothetical protein
VRVSDELRSYVHGHYLTGSMAGRELLAIADKIECLERGASPVDPDRPLVMEDDQP